LALKVERVALYVDQAAICRLEFFITVEALLADRNRNMFFVVANRRTPVWSKPRH
jgi:hypothetical protein